jgi:hypothetical protein
MPSTTLTCNKDARIADPGGGSGLGAGASDYLPVGLYSGYTYRSLLGFSGFSASWVSITSAVLHIKTSSQFYVAFGSDPDIIVKRLTESWSEGSSVSLSSSNSVDWDNQPNSTSTNQATKDVTTAENTWVTVTITSLMQDALADNAFYGLQIRANSESASTDVTEFYAREYGSNDAYIEVTYTTNVAPSAPTVTTPAASGTPRIAPATDPTATDPDFVFTHVDSDGDALLNYDLQVSTDSTFASATHFNGTLMTAGISGNTVTTTYEALRAAEGTGTALSRGTVYYVRMRTYSASGILTAGAWSAAVDFRTNALPVVTAVDPAATGYLSHLVYTTGAGWTTPRLYVDWSVSDSDSDSQTKYRVVVTESATAGGAYAEVYDSGQVASSSTDLTVPLALNEGYFYKVYVDVYDGYEWYDDGTGGTNGLLMGGGANRARWAMGLYRFDMGAAPTSITLNTLSTTTTATSSVAVEYGSNTTTSTPGTFYASIGSVALQRYFFYRTYLMAWGSASPTSPSLDALIIDYAATVIVPDNWERSDTVRVYADPGSYVYGTQGLRIDVNAGNNVAAGQLVSVLPDTDYVLSGRIKAQGNPDAFIAISTGPVTGAIVGTEHLVTDTDWARYSVAWNSGSNTEVYVICRSATSSVSGAAWFDALKLEASAVVTPWSPGFVGQAVSIDAGGIQLDASAGAVFRLRGSSGGIDDRVDLGDNGLTIGSNDARINAAIRIAKRRLFR